MANTRELVKRRKAIRNIRKITRTMELIAAARFKKAMDRATQAEAFTRKITELAADLSASATNVSHPLLAGVGSMSALFRTDVKLAEGAVQVAKYGDGRPAVAYKVTGGSLAVGLPAFLDDGNGPNIMGYAAVIANAGRWVGLPAMEYEPVVA